MGKSLIVGHKYLDLLQPPVVNSALLIRRIRVVFSLSFFLIFNVPIMAVR